MKATTGDTECDYVEMLPQSQWMEEAATNYENIESFPEAAEATSNSGADTPRALQRANTVDTSQENDRCPSNEGSSDGITKATNHCDNQVSVIEEASHYGTNLTYPVTNFQFKLPPNTFGPFGYCIDNLETFLANASLQHPANIPMVVTTSCQLYVRRTEAGHSPDKSKDENSKEIAISLGIVVNALFKNQEWLYVKTPHSDEGYLLYKNCLPLCVLPSQHPQGALSVKNVSQPVISSHSDKENHQTLGVRRKVINSKNTPAKHSRMRSTSTSSSVDIMNKTDNEKLYENYHPPGDDSHSRDDNHVRSRPEKRIDKASRSSSLPRPLPKFKYNHTLNSNARFASIALSNPFCLPRSSSNPNRGSNSDVTMISSSPQTNEERQPASEVRHVLMKPVACDKSHIGFRSPFGEKSVDNARNSVAPSLSNIQRGLQLGKDSPSAFRPVRKDGNTSGSVVVSESFTSRQKNALSVARGEHVIILSKANSDWFWVRSSRGHEGYIPSHIVVPVSQYQCSNVT